MAIQNSIELEAVLTRVIIKLDRQIAERGSWPALEDARRNLDHLRTVTRNTPKLKAARDKLKGAVETILTEVPNDGALHDDIWDMEDFVDYRA